MVFPAILVNGTVLPALILTFAFADSKSQIRKLSSFLLCFVLWVTLLLFINGFQAESTFIDVCFNQYVP